MPRKSASLVPHAVSSLLKGGYMKAVPAFYPAVLNNPPLSIPPRTPYTRTSDDLPANVVRQRKVQSEREQGDAASHPRRTQRYYKSRTPSLKPQPIEYLEDRVRKQFFKDHPWEGFQPRHLVEKEVLDEPRVAPKEVTELVWWSTNPQPEDVVAFTVHLHRHHDQSLSSAYIQALSQFHGIKAEREISARYAVLEARAYGAEFNSIHNKRSQKQYKKRYADSSSPPAATQPETMRGFDKSERALDSWRRAYNRAMNVPSTTEVDKTQDGKKRTRAVYMGDFNGGDKYVQGAEAIREGDWEAFAGNPARRRDAESQEGLGTEYGTGSTSTTRSDDGAHSWSQLQTWAMRSAENQEQGGGQQQQGQGQAAKKPAADVMTSLRGLL